MTDRENWSWWRRWDMQAEQHVRRQRESAARLGLTSGTKPSTGATAMPSPDTLLGPAPPVNDRSWDSDEAHAAARRRIPLPASIEKSYADLIRPGPGQPGYGLSPIQRRAIIFLDLYNASADSNKSAQPQSEMKTMKPKKSAPARVPPRSSGPARPGPQPAGVRRAGGTIHKAGSTYLTLSLHEDVARVARAQASLAGYKTYASDEQHVEDDELSLLDGGPPSGWSYKQPHGHLHSGLAAAGLPVG
jgi:hypothetical protein